MATRGRRITAAATTIRSEAQRTSTSLDSDRTSFVADSTRVLGELRDSLAALLAAAPSPATSCTEVESALGIDAMLAWQVLRIARVDEPFAAGIKVPARVSMSKLLKAAARRRIADTVMDRVSRAFEEFERLVVDYAGSRAEFEMMVSAYSPAAREKAELLGKQSAFRGMSQLKGVTAEADFTSYFWMPSRDPEKLDFACVEGHIGIRRIWPSAPILFSEATFGAESILRTLSGERVENGREALLQRFSSSPLPTFREHVAGALTYHSVESQDVGSRSAIDLVRGTYREEAKFRFRRVDGQEYAGSIEVLEFPAKRLTVDVFLHEDVYPGAAPELAIYDTTSDGLVTRFNDPEREHDRLEMQESIRSLGTGFAKAGLPHIPRYMDMLEHLCSMRGLNASQFRGYRLDVHYPVYGAEYMLAFRLPEAPEGTATSHP